VSKRIKLISVISLVMFFIFCNGMIYAAGCQIASGGGLSFGDYDVSDLHSLDSMMSFTVTCDEMSPASVSIEIGPSTTSGNILSREMHHSFRADRMSYNLFTNASMSSIWGNGTSGSLLILNNVNNNTPQQILIYGRIPARQNLSAGTYSDYITMTVLPNF